MSNPWSFESKLPCLPKPLRSSHSSGPFRSAQHRDGGIPVNVPLEDTPLADAKSFVERHCNFLESLRANLHQHLGDTNTHLAIELSKNGKQLEIPNLEEIIVNASLSKDSGEFLPSVQKIAAYLSFLASSNNPISFKLAKESAENLRNSSSEIRGFLTHLIVSKSSQRTHSESIESQDVAMDEADQQASSAP